MSSARAGYLACMCADAPEGADVAWSRPLPTVLASGFALSVLAQALTVSILPVAGWQLAQQNAFSALPLAAMLIGAILATFPASLLLDRFGRRAAFVLGASLGIGGGLLVAFALIERQFSILCLGAFWLGTAQGFGLFYRHAAVVGGSASASAWVLSAGAAAGLIAPSLSGFAEWLAEPYLMVGTALAASAVQVAALSLAISMREPPVEIAAAGAETRSSFMTAALIGGVAWFVMAAAMQMGPLALIACTGSLSGVTGLVAWHLLAMYASSALVPSFVRRFGWTRTGSAAAALILPAAAFIVNASSPSVIFAAMLAVGAGWGIAFGAATIGLHSGRTSPARLALFDAIMLTAALAGVLGPGAISG